MTIFDSIRYPVPDLKPWDGSLDDELKSIHALSSFISSLPFEIVDDWKERPEFQWAMAKAGTYFINQNNIDLLRRVILEFEDDNI